MTIVIREKTTGVELARAELGADVVKYEGNYYFAPTAVAAGVLRPSASTSRCPMKGTSTWVDCVTPDGQVIPKVAWVYARPNPGHELIAGRYGFYPGNRGATRQDD
jgi:uncharacterized protein (DUF427 family)